MIYAVWAAALAYSIRQHVAQREAEKAVAVEDDRVPEPA